MKRLFYIGFIYFVSVFALFAQKNHPSFKESNGSYVKDMRKVFTLIAKQKYEKAYLELTDLRKRSDSEHIKHPEYDDTYLDALSPLPESASAFLLAQPIVLNDTTISSNLLECYKTIVSVFNSEENRLASAKQFINEQGLNIDNLYKETELKIIENTRNSARSEYEYDKLFSVLWDKSPMKQDLLLEQEKIYWETSMAKPNLLKCNHYITKYTKLEQRDHISRVEYLVDSLNFRSMPHDIDNLEKFIKLYPNSNFKNEASALIESLTYKKTKEENSLEGYARFCKQYPDGKYSKEAQDSLSKLIRYTYLRKDNSNLTILEEYIKSGSIYGYSYLDSCALTFYNKLTHNPLCKYALGVKDPKTNSYTEVITTPDGNIQTKEYYFDEWGLLNLSFEENMYYSYETDINSYSATSFGIDNISYFEIYKLYNDMGYINYSQIFNPSKKYRMEANLKSKICTFEYTYEYDNNGRCTTCQITQEGVLQANKSFSYNKDNTIASVKEIDKSGKSKIVEFKYEFDSIGQWTKCKEFSNGKISRETKRYYYSENTIMSNNRINGHEYVDLGLPSGTLWSKEIITSFAHETSEEVDEATLMWGGNWQTPSVVHFQELQENCTFKYEGKVLVAKSKINGNQLLLYGCRGENGGDGIYRTKTPSSDPLTNTIKGFEKPTNPENEMISFVFETKNHEFPIFESLTLSETTKAFVLPVNTK